MMEKTLSDENEPYQVPGTWQGWFSSALIYDPAWYISLLLLYYTLVHPTYHCVREYDQRLYVTPVFVFSFVNRPFYPASSVHPVSVLIPHPRERYWFFCGHTLWDRGRPKKKLNKKPANSSVKQVKCQPPSLSIYNPKRLFFFSSTPIFSVWYASRNLLRASAAPLHRVARQDGCYRERPAGRYLVWAEDAAGVLPPCVGGGDNLGRVCSAAVRGELGFCRSFRKWHGPILSIHRWCKPQTNLRDLSSVHHTRRTPRGNA